MGTRGRERKVALARRAKELPSAGGRLAIQQRRILTALRKILTALKAKPKVSTERQASWTTRLRRPEEPSLGGFLEEPCSTHCSPCYRFLDDIKA